MQYRKRIVQAEYSDEIFQNLEENKKCFIEIRRIIVMKEELDINYVVQDTEKIAVKDLRENAGMSRKEFCEYFKIPYRTLQSWELEDRDAPEYVKRLLAYVIRFNEMLEEKEINSEEEIIEKENEED